ncbi:MAG: hypothetical protein OXC31_26355 [Spirochaetaceae bacterium]|nr:hypothetical protein [Spirochaetaceae bacterium]
MSEGFETYCGLLRLYDGFSMLEDGAVPEFEYDHAHPGLRELRDRYRLDNVAGDGDEMARSLRLLDWLHHHVRHANTDLDLEMNSQSLLEHAFDAGKESGINCRMLSATWEKCARHLGRWEDSWARDQEQRKRRVAQGVITSSIGSFAAAPAG